VDASAGVPPGLGQLIRDLCLRCMSPLYVALLLLRRLVDAERELWQHDASDDPERSATRHRSPLVSFRPTAYNRNVDKKHSH